MSTTIEILLTLADRAEASLQPPARGLATANTLREFAAIADLPAIEAHELVAAFIILGRPTDDDAPPVIARRATCRELADIIPGGVLGMATVSAPALCLWAAFDRIGGEGPRIDAIKATAMREFKEMVNVADKAAKMAFILWRRIDARNQMAVA